MNHLDLFSGIGGFALAAEEVWPGIEHTFCDNEPFAQAVLQKHWPNSKIYGDIRTLTADTYRSNGQAGADEKEGEQRHKSPQLVPLGRNQFDLLTGGFPCQPFSQAGRRRGTKDSRYLWPEMLRIIREFHPRWVVGENVGGLVTWNEGMVLEQIHADLEGEGYEVQAFIIPAVAVNAPHRRERVWIVAHSASDGFNTKKQGELRKDKEPASTRENDTKGYGYPILVRGQRNFANTKRTGYAREINQERPRARHNSGLQPPDWSRNWAEIAAELCRMDDGLPRRLDRNPRLKSLGNAIVPQVAAQIFKAIKAVDNI